MVNGSPDDYPDKWRLQHLSKIPDFLLASPPSPEPQADKLDWLLKQEPAKPDALNWLLADMGAPVQPPSWLESNARLDASENAGLLATHIAKPAQASKPNDDLDRFISHQSLRKVFKQFKGLLQHDASIRKPVSQRMSLTSEALASMVSGSQYCAGMTASEIRSTYASSWGVPSETIVVHYDSHSDTFDFVAHGTGETSVTLSTKDVKAIAWKLASHCPSDELSEARRQTILGNLLSRPRLATRSR